MGRTERPVLGRRRLARTRLLAAPAALLAVPAALLSGCGNSRAPVPSVTTPAPPSAFRALSFPAIGIRLKAPRNWSVGAGEGPLVTTISSGTAIVAVWRYRRQSPPPSGQVALAQARSKLIAQARGRDPALRLLRSRVFRLDGAPAIELDALERIAGKVRRVRSTHVFRPRAELVLEEYAPARVFRGVDRTVFVPLKRSLVLAASTA